MVQYRKEIDYLKEIIRKQIDKEETPEQVLIDAQLAQLKVLQLQLNKETDDGKTVEEAFNSKQEESKKAIAELNDYNNKKCGIQMLLSAENSLAQIKAKKDKLEANEKEFTEQIEQLT